ncbi:hypothetical protein [Mycolicibacter icosiumassiliensis]|uniref:hypothetical protein n=1 Tax=Mycolicibacter icosiumassiliensis TaxID=1792835 RepID=UPI00082D337A|nr:hypothetical protein [Mycolicibacter icosiumassiliensis]
MNTAYIVENPHNINTAITLCQRHEAEGIVTDVFPAWSGVAAAGAIALVEGSVQLTAAKTGMQLIVTGYAPEDPIPSARSAIETVLSKGAQRNIHVTLLIDSASAIPEEWRDRLQVIDPAALSALGL